MNEPFKDQVKPHGVQGFVASFGELCYTAQGVKSLENPITLPIPLCNVVLIEPLIPENTGNIARTCVGTRSHLHLVGPMGFEITESRVKRAGLDYWEHLQWTEYPSTDAWWRSVPEGEKQRVFFVETTARRSLYSETFRAGDWLVFGKETTGLEKTLLELHDAHALYLPMPGPTRSLNLANSVAVAVFEVMRQALIRGS